jgi:aldose 1-epimerase
MRSPRAWATSNETRGTTPRTMRSADWPHRDGAVRMDRRVLDGSRTLAAGELQALVSPGRGMLVASLRHRGAELLRRVEDLDGAAAAGKTAAIPLLYPWANRLSGMRYTAAGRAVVLDPASPLLHWDRGGLPMHGVPWSRLAWQVLDASPERITARLDWTCPERLAVFPFPHRVDLALALRSDGLTLETTVSASSEGPVPVSFGFHPFLGLPGLGRADWKLTLPAMRKLTLDSRGIPTGVEEPFAGFDAPLGDVDFDDGFALPGQPAALSIDGAGRRITVDFLEGFAYAQVFAPKEKEFIALEPMTAPTDALTTGRGLRLVQPGQLLRTVFRIRVDDTR